MNPYWVIRTDGNHALGLGHVKRCLTLANELSARRQMAVFVLRHADANVLQLIRQSGHRAEVLPFDTPLDHETKAYERLGIRSGCGILVDMSHHVTFADARRIPDYFSALRSCFPVVTLLDNVGEYCIADCFELPIDIVIIPYACEQPRRLKSVVQILCVGPDYFVIDHSYLQHTCKPRTIATVASKVLVTMGGSDPSGESGRVLRALSQIDDRMLVVRVIIGPAFSESAMREITLAATESAHYVMAVEAPETLAPQMEWCDMAVSATGHTKYELAVTGTPALLISAEAKSQRFNSAFQRLRTAQYLGFADMLEEGQIAGAVLALLDNPNERERMSRSGTMALDGNGASRLVNTMLEMVQTASM